MIRVHILVYKTIQIMQDNIKLKMTPLRLNVVCFDLRNQRSLVL